MSSIYWQRGISNKPESSFNSQVLSGRISQTRVTGDIYFTSDITILNAINGSIYKIIQYSNTTNLATGTISSNKYTIPDISADENPMPIQSFISKYGYFLYTNISNHTSIGSNIYVAQRVDVNITESNTTTVAGYPITINYTTKVITTSASVTKEQIYDFVKYSNSLIANVNNTDTILDTGDGVNYTLNNLWVLNINTPITNGINLTGNIIVNGIFSLINMNITGSITFNVAGTYDITDSNISEVINTSGGNIIINTGGVTNITTNTGPNITIVNVKTFSFTLQPSITLYEWRIYSINNMGSLIGAVELAGEEMAGSDNQTYNYEYSSDIPIGIQIISQPNNDYVELIQYTTLQNINQHITFFLEKDYNN